MIDDPHGEKTQRWIDFIQHNVYTISMQVLDNLHIIIWETVFPKIIIYGVTGVVFPQIYVHCLRCIVFRTGIWFILDNH